MGSTINTTFNQICILGLGYIGLPTAAMFATHQKKVIGVDINPKIIQTLQKGDIHIQETGLNTLVQSAIASGNLTLSTQIEPAQAYIITVPTPFLPDSEHGDAQVFYKKADMSYVCAAAEAIVPHLQHGCLVVLESTSPPHTTTNLVRPILERSGLIAGEDFYLAYSPERVLPGQILKELVENDRVIGGINRASAEAGQALYATFVRGEIMLTDSTTAEMVKLMENTYRDVNIALANEFSRLAEQFDVNVWQAIGIANRHPRVNILNPGPGVGGHCISVDPWFLVEAAPRVANLIRTARQVNDSQPGYVVSLIEKYFGPVENKRIAALGLAYKPDVDDLRESPAVEIAHLLHAKGANVVSYEPCKPDAKLPGLHLVSSLEEAVLNADLILLLVKHHDFAVLSPEKLAPLTSARVIMDCVRCFDSSDWMEQDYKIIQLGNSNEL